MTTLINPDTITGVTLANAPQVALYINTLSAMVLSRLMASGTPSISLALFSPTALLPTQSQL